MIAGPRAFAGQAKALVWLLQRKPIDTTTEEGRARERYRRVAWTAITSALIRAISMVTALISVPLTVGYLGPERYGLWVTISSTIAMLAFADFGLGNGLLNRVAIAHGRNDRDEACRYVSSAFFLLFVIAAIGASVFWIAYPFISWADLFNVASPEATNEAGPTVAVLAMCFLLGLPLGVVSRTQQGYQEGFADNVWTGTGNLLSLAAVLLVIYLELGLPWLVLAFAGTSLVATMANGVVLFRVRKPWLLPRLRAVSGGAMLQIFRIGSLFLVLQVAVAVAYQSDNFIIAHLLGPDNVAVYAVTMKMFAFSPMIAGLALNALWPAYCEATVRGDIDWMKKTLKGSMITSAMVNVPAGLLLVLAGVPILHMWAGSEITPSSGLLLGFGAWTALSSISGPLAMFFNGAGLFRFQVIAATAMALTNLATSIVLVRTIGLPGAIWGTVIAQTLMILIPSAVYVPRFLTKLAIAHANNDQNGQFNPTIPAQSGEAL